MDIHRLLSEDTTSPLDRFSASRAIPLQTPAIPIQQFPVQSANYHDEDPPGDLEFLAVVDTNVAGFLRSVLGTRKWRIFSAKLCERKTPSYSGALGSKSQLKGKGKQKQSIKPQEAEDGVLHSGTSPCALVFLMKVEIVKEVLRAYVPNPYHPSKAEAHIYAAAPGGVVHVTRASVLALCQWSNTQFAYWSRRSEAVSVLARHDPGLQDLFYILYKRLYESEPPAGLFSSSIPTTPLSSSRSTSPLYQGVRSASSRTSALEEERRLRVARKFTGKGLDGLIAIIKKQTGASQFLRGRQSSLDPFGIHLIHGTGVQDGRWPVIMPSDHGKATQSQAYFDLDEYDQAPKSTLKSHSKSRSGSLLYLAQPKSPEISPPWSSDGVASPESFRSSSTAAARKRKREGMESSDESLLEVNPSGPSPEHYDKDASGAKRPKLER